MKWLVIGFVVVLVLLAALYAWTIWTQGFNMM